MNTLTVDMTKATEGTLIKIKFKGLVFRVSLLPGREAIGVTITDNNQTQLDTEVTVVNSKCAIIQPQ